MFRDRQNVMEDKNDGNNLDDMYRCCLKKRCDVMALRDWYIARSAQYLCEDVSNIRALTKGCLPWKWYPEYSEKLLDLRWTREGETIADVRARVIL